ncbi:MAG: major facilitator superfamily domain-containing protein [Benniella sp.]|nr:MAG: major facilitator superfamily domain-containing protein [Benniella sp.]
MAVSKAMRQIILIGIICFGTIGMFNAMSSIGNAGKHSPTAQNLAVTSSSIAYIVGFLVAGGAHNMIGPRLCVLFGGMTFVLYAGSMMLAKDNDHSLYPPLAGILLGLGAGCIWVSQGAMMMSYPTEDNKGQYIAVFWAIFNLGAVLGSVLPLVMNSGPGMDPDDVSPSTYIVYMVVMGLSTLLAVFLSRPSSIVRDNGEPVSVAKFSGLRAETIAILSVFCDWRMLLLIPAFFFSNFSYTYQFNDFNGFGFNIRTRSLNSIVFWVAQIIGALLLGYLLDRIPVKRPRRALLGLLVIAILFMATWIAAFMVQTKHKWERRPRKQSDLIDYEHGSNYTGLLAIYAMFGFCDAAFAVYCYWLMGALSNKHDELSRYAGFFKSIQSLGSAVAAPLDLAQTPLLAFLITNWILCAFSIAAMFLVCRTITDTTIEDMDDPMEDDQPDDDDNQEHDQSDSYCDESVEGPGATLQNQSSSKDPSHSLEGDTSTICATSDAGKAPNGLPSSRQPSGVWRPSSRTSGTHADKMVERDSRHMLSSDGFLDPGERSLVGSSHRTGTSTSSTDEIPMTDISHATTSGLGVAYSAERPSSSTATPRYSNASLPQSSLPALYISSPPHDPTLTRGDMDIHSVSPGHNTGRVSPISTPTLMISGDFSSSAPVYGAHLDPLHLQSQWPGASPIQVGSAGSASDQASTSSAVMVAEDEGQGGGGEHAHNGLAFVHPYPNMPFDPVAHGVRNRSFVQYDDDQDMDSIDTHSISSMLSGHDSMPEMTDMLEQSIDGPG